MEFPCALGNVRWTGIANREPGLAWKAIHSFPETVCDTLCRLRDLLHNYLVIQIFSTHIDDVCYVGLRTMSRLRRLAGAILNPH